MECRNCTCKNSVLVIWNHIHGEPCVQVSVKRKTRHAPISLKYKLQGETESSISYLAYEREDGWWACGLYQFTCDHIIVHFHIIFEGFDKFKGFDNYSSLEVEGIEVQPLENVEHIDEKQVKQPILDSESDANWEEKMPTDYEDIMESSGNSLQWTTKEEAYSIIRKGFFINIRDEDRSIVSPSFLFFNICSCYRAYEHGPTRGKHHTLNC
ncbi:hypothetical protein HanPI659440_Chr13g0499181 [Helianthus annuus]|nr:hypothetical protein HanPI659440_Chr13g0499181 [Helianthus annuus]